MTGLYKCSHVFTDDDEQETGTKCPETFSSHHGRQTHEKSHIKRPCRWCGRMISNNGHTQHESVCDEQPHALPWQVWDDLLADMVSHANEIPAGMVCAVFTKRGAVIMTQAAAVRLSIQLLDRESVVLIPTDLLNQPETAARWRRVDPTQTPEQEPASNGQPATNTKPSGQELAGVDFNSIA